MVNVVIRVPERGLWWPVRWWLMFVAAAATVDAVSFSADGFAESEAYAWALQLPFFSTVGPMVLWTCAGAAVVAVVRSDTSAARWAIYLFMIHHVVFTVSVVVWNVSDADPRQSWPAAVKWAGYVLMSGLFLALETLRETGTMLPPSRIPRVGAKPVAVVDPPAAGEGRGR